MKLSQSLLILALGLTGAPAALAEHHADYHECRIEYEIRHKAIPGKNTDTGPFSKQFTACVRNLGDCTRRGEALARARETLYVPEGEGEEPDLRSLNVMGHSLDGRCSELD